MDKVQFYIEERSLAEMVAHIRSNSATLAELLVTLEHVADFDLCELFCYDDFYSIEINGQPVAQLLYDGAVDGKIRDLIVRLDIILSGCSGCALSDNDEISHGFYSLKSNGKGTLITAAPVSIFGWWDRKLMFHARTIPEVTLALRKLFIALRLGHESLESYSPILFPSLYFHVSPAQFKNVGLDYNEFICSFISHLSYLNDFSSRDFKNTNESHVIIAKAGAHGVEMSPESPSTHRNTSAMAERNITIAEKKICCEWHTKLNHHRGRIHFYPWEHSDATVKKIVGPKVIVGIITDHLT